jgi:hypothetical protein
MEILLALFYIVPAALFYAWAVGFAWLALRPKRTIAARIACGLLAALPIAWYLSGFVTGALDYRHQRAHIAGLAGVARPHDPPRTLVVFGKREPWQDELVEIGALEAIYVNDWKTGWRNRGPWARIAYERSPRCLNAHTTSASVMAMRRAQAAFAACAIGEEVPAAPTESLTFHIGERWHLSLRGTFPSDLTPYELYWTRDGREDELVGYWEQAQGDWPMVPPVLTVFGFAKTQFRDRQNPKPSPQAFLLDRLGLDAATVRPPDAPDDAERREQFGRLARSTDVRDRDIALRIATVTGDAFLTGDDIDGLLAQPEVTDDIVARAGGLSFCAETGRLCAFADRLAAACRRRDAGAAACQRLDTACGTCGGAGGRR